MIIYCNLENLNEIEDNENNEIYYNTYIYTCDGIFKKYKYHFYKMRINDQFTSYTYKENDFFVQEKDDLMDREDIITTIPYKHYFVNRKIIKNQVNDNLTWVKEIDNDIYIKEYFITDLPLEFAFEEISLFSNNKLLN